MPGDYDIEYASPWAGANYLPLSQKFFGAERGTCTEAAQWDANTWLALEKLARCNPEAGVHFQEAALYNRAKDLEGGKGTALAASTVPDPWYKQIVPNFKKVSTDSLPSGYDSGNTFTSVCINTSIYLPWLTSRCLQAGVVFKRAILNHVSEASQIHHSRARADVVVNCTGLSALTLGGVEDTNMTPARGQTVLVRNEADAMYACSGCDDGEDEVCYMMQRAAGGGTLLGGCYQKGNWDPQIDPNLAMRIMARCVKLCPSLTNGKGPEHLSIIRHGVGLRPVRVRGTRIEKEKIGDLWVVHNYGHGGYGYQSSYGCSQVVLELVSSILNPQAKL
ncbi:D-amino acid oxidase [Lecanora helva]